MSLARADDVETDPRARVAANEASPAVTGQKATKETVLVGLPPSAPSGVEEEIAREHKLELVEKLPLPTLGMRVVRYSIPDARSLSAVIDRLRADKRVSSAQANIVYKELEPAPPKAVARTAKMPPGGPRRTAVAKPADRREISLFDAPRPRRSARIAAGDIMAGGL